MADPDDLRARGALAEAGRCGTCAQVRVIRSGRGSVFLMCERGLRKEAGFVKYPPLPVLRCAGWEPAPRAGND